MRYRQVKRSQRLYLKHKHESFESCSLCNSKLRECQFCGSDIAMVGGSCTMDEGATCNRCLGKWKNVNFVIKDYGLGVMIK